MPAATRLLRFLLLSLALMAAGCSAPPPVAAPLAALTATPAPTVTAAPDGAALLAAAIAATGRSTSYSATHEFSLIQDDANQLGARGSCGSSAAGSICSTELASLFNGQTSRQSGLTLQRDGQFWFASDAAAANWVGLSAAEANLPGYVNGVIDPLPFLETVTNADWVLREVVSDGQDLLVLSLDVDNTAFLLLLLGEAQGSAVLAAATGVDFGGNVWIGADDSRIYQLQATFTVTRAADALQISLQQMLSGYDEPVEIPETPDA